MIPHNMVTKPQGGALALQRVYDSLYWVQGPEVKALEEDLCRTFGKKHAIAVASGTGALRLALIACRGMHHPSSRRLIPAYPGYACVTVDNAVRSVSPQDFSMVDVERGSWVLNTNDLGPNPEKFCYIAVNTFGVTAPIGAMLTAGCGAIIEDASHGGHHGGGTTMVMSHHATKLIGGMYGGSVLTDEDNVAEYVRDLRDFDDKAYRYGRLNDHLSDLHASLIRVRLKGLQQNLDARSYLAGLYMGHFIRHGHEEVGLSTTGDGAWYRFVIDVPDPKALIAQLRKFLVEAAQPVEPRPALGLRNADYAYDHLVSLPLFEGLTPVNVEHVAESVCRALDRIKAGQ